LLLQIDNRMATFDLHLTIVRHGKSMGNEKGFFAGHMDVDLCEAGYQQAKLTAEVLKDETFDLAFASDMTRAVNTAEVVLKTSGLTSITKDKLMRERCYGVMEGKNRSDVIEHARQMGVQVDPRDPTRNFVPQGGETEDEVKTRAIQFIEKLLASDEVCGRSSGRRILLSGHSGWIRELVNWLAGGHKVSGIPADKLHSRPSNGSITEFSLVVKERHLVSGKCTRFYDDSHIQRNVVSF